MDPVFEYQDLYNEAAANLNIGNFGTINATIANITKTINLATLTPLTILEADASSNIVSAPALTNGQLLIGSNLLAPSAGNITSSNSSITITNGAGTIDLSTGLTGIFNNITLLDATNQIRFHPASGNQIIVSSPLPAGNRTYTLPDTGANSSFVMTDSVQTINGAKTFTADMTGLEFISNQSAQVLPGATSSMFGMNSADSILYIVNGANAGITLQNNVSNVIADFNGLSNMDVGQTAQFVIRAASNSSTNFITISGVGGFLPFQPTGIQIERNAAVGIEATIGIAAAANDIVFGSAAGNLCIATNHLIGSSAQICIGNGSLNGCIMNAAGTFTYSAGVVSSSTSTGTIVVSGGVGISGSEYIGINLNVGGTTQVTGANTGSLQNAGGFYNALDSLHGGQMYFNNVTAPTTGTGPACIVSLNTANTYGPQLVCFGNGDPSNASKRSLLGPNHLAIGTFTAMTTNLAATFYHWPMGSSGTLDPWGLVAANGGGQTLITLPTSGQWHFECSVGISGSLVQSLINIALYKNATFGAGPPYPITGGTILARGSTTSDPTGLNTYVSLNWSGALSAADTLSIAYYDKVNNLVVMLTTENSFACWQVR